MYSSLKQRMRPKPCKVVRNTTPSFTSFYLQRYSPLPASQVHKKKRPKRNTMGPLCKLAIILSPFMMSVLLILTYNSRQGMYFSSPPTRQGVNSLGSIPEASLMNFSTSMDTLKTVADVNGANMDHKGSITNPCITRMNFVTMAAERDPLTPFSPVGMHSFILRSAYRLSPTTFTAIGLSPLALHESNDNVRASSCLWVGDGGVYIEGNVFPLWPGEHHFLMYESVIYKCQLLQPTPKNSAGKLFLEIDKQHAEVYEESADADNLEVIPEPQREVSACSFPIYRDVNPQRVFEWIQYMYHNLGVEYVLLNDGGSVNEDMIKVLRPFLNAGIVEVNDIRAQFRYESKHNVLTLNDCLYSQRFKTRWLLFLDFDEFLHIDTPNTLSSLLKSYNDRPYISFGSLWWSVNLCSSEMKKNDWPLEKMQFHWPHIYCVEPNKAYPEDKCLNYFGHRKYIVNPRKVWAVEIHRPIEPIHGGVDLSTSIARINHFQGLMRNSLNICSEIVPNGGVEWWTKDETISKMAVRAKLLGSPYAWARVASMFH